MGEYRAFSFFTVFITLYFAFMIPFGGADAFTEQEFDVGFDDITFEPPDFEDVDFTPEEFETRVYDLEEDAIDWENVEFHDIEEENITVRTSFLGDEEIEDRIRTQNIAVSKDDPDQEAWIRYEVEGYEYLDTRVSYNTFTTNYQSLEWLPDGQTQAIYNVDDIEEDAIRAEIQWSDTLPEDQYLFWFETYRQAPSSSLVPDPLQRMAQGMLNFVQLVLAFITWMANAFLMLLSMMFIVTQLPWYLNIPFALYVTYLGFKAATMA